MPVGRDLAGNVVRQRSTVPLEPSGRELDLELRYSRPLDVATALSANLFVRHQPGHEADAAPELGIGARVSRRF